MSTKIFDTLRILIFVIAEKRNCDHLFVGIDTVFYVPPPLLFRLPLQRASVLPRRWEARRFTESKDRPQPQVVFSLPLQRASVLPWRWELRRFTESKDRPQPQVVFRLPLQRASVLPWRWELRSLAESKDRPQPQVVFRALAARIRAALAVGFKKPRRIKGQAAATGGVPLALQRASVLPRRWDSRSLQRTGRSHRWCCACPCACPCPCNAHPCCPGGGR